MLTQGQRFGAIVINNDMCDEKAPNRIAPYGCRRAVRAILPKGCTLEVWEPNSTESTTIRGVAE